MTVASMGLHPPWVWVLWDLVAQRLGAERP